MLDVGGDVETVQAWIAARAGSTATVKACRREATRLLLWLQHERQPTLAQMDVADCMAFMAFMAFRQHVPALDLARPR
ncbi:MAG: hypothetical protein EOO79_04590 [Oxalobacteraceae bacterium]|nr:MAG: hypothetical protein EOO79_04590 [Oxalobacteraceae bacterium]